MKELPKIQRDMGDTFITEFEFPMLQSKLMEFNMRNKEAAKILELPNARIGSFVSCKTDQ